MHGSRKNRNQANAIKHSRHFLARRRAMADRYFNFKTKKTGGTAEHGFPDPGYLERVSSELDEVGVHQDVVPLDSTFVASFTDEVMIEPRAVAELIRGQFKQARGGPRLEGMVLA